MRASGRAAFDGRSTHNDRAMLRILVVDDDAAVRESLRRALKLEQYEVELAADGVEALELIRESASEPDAVVLDVLDAAARRARGLPAAAPRPATAIPILMLTARDEVSDRVAGLDAGADDYVVKPFALEELLARLRALLRRARTRGRRTCFASPTSSSIPSTREVRRGDDVDRADAHRVLAARAVPTQPAPGA